jgi:hypothetical protein
MPRCDFIAVIVRKVLPLPTEFMVVLSRGQTRRS